MTRTRGLEVSTPGLVIYLNPRAAVTVTLRLIRSLVLLGEGKVLGKQPSNVIIPQSISSSSFHLLLSVGGQDTMITLSEVCLVLNSPLLLLLQESLPGHRASPAARFTLTSCVTKFAVHFHNQMVWTAESRGKHTRQFGSSFTNSIGRSVPTNLAFVLGIYISFKHLICVYSLGLIHDRPTKPPPLTDDSAQFGRSVGYSVWQRRLCFS